MVVVDLNHHHPLITLSSVKQMPTYPLINKTTGEKKELSMSMKAYDEWREANPDWDKDWSAGISGTIYGTRNSC